MKLNLLLTLFVISAAFAIIIEDEQIPLENELPSLLETFVYYDPSCGKSLCPASSVTAVIKGYQCNCHNAGEHPDCGCNGGGSNGAGSHGSSNGGQAPPCQCNKAVNKCSCPPLISNGPAIRPFAKAIGPQNPLPSMVQGQCVANIAGLTPGNCRNRANSVHSESSESSVAHSSESSAHSSESSAHSSESSATPLSSASAVSAAVSASSASTPTPSSSSASESSAPSAMPAAVSSATPTPPSSSATVPTSSPSASSASAIMNSGVLAPSTAAPKNQPALTGSASSLVASASSTVLPGAALSL